MLAEEEARYDMKKEEIDGFEDSEEIARVQEEIRKSVAHATPWNDLKDWVMVHLEVFHETDPVPLWRKALKKIDGNFGSGVAAVFRLYRWLFLMNTYISIVWLMFVIWSVTPLPPVYIALYTQFWAMFAGVLPLYLRLVSILSGFREFCEINCGKRLTVF